MYYVYVLRSSKDGKYYVGFTADLEDRLKRHIEGRSKATRDRLPLYLVGCKKFESRKEAQDTERKFKINRNTKFIEQKLVEWSGDSAL